MAEWLKATVLKTVFRVTGTGVRIPLPPPNSLNTPQGRFTLEEVNDLILMLKSGALPASVKVIEIKTL